MIYGFDKPVMCLSRDFNRKKTKHLDDIFVADRSSNILIFKPAHEIHKSIESRKTNIFDRNKKYCGVAVHKSTVSYMKNTIGFQMSGTEDCDCFVSNIDICSYIYPRGGAFSYIETPNKIYDISGSEWHTGLTPKKLYELLKKNNILPENSTYNRVEGKNISTFTLCDTEKVCKAILDTNIPIVDIKHVFKAFSEEHEVLKTEDISSIEELFNSPDEESVKLGFMLLGTSNYSKLYFTTRAMLYRNASKIRRAVNRPEIVIPGFVDTIGNDVLSIWEDREFRITDLNIILNSNEEMHEEDRNMLNMYLSKQINTALDRLVSKKTKKSFNKLGFNFEAKLNKI